MYKIMSEKIVVCICKNGHEFEVPKHILDQHEVECECGADRDLNAELNNAFEDALLKASEIPGSGVTLHEFDIEGDDND